MGVYLVLTDGMFGGSDKKLFDNLYDAAKYSMSFNMLTRIYKLSTEDKTIKDLGLDIYVDKKDNLIKDSRGNRVD